MPQHRRRGRFAPSVVLIAVIVTAFAHARSADAADWMFRRSYFSHAVPPEQALRSPVPRSLSAYRPAVVSPYPGFSVQSVQRFNNVVIPSGASVDYTLLRSENVRRMP